MPDFTALHQELGRPPGPITDDMLDEAVAQGVAEGDQLDWKGALPSEKALANSDVPKDIAAFANSGGGVLIYGVEEEQRRATGRTDVGEVSEGYERTFRRVAVSGIHPPVVNLRISQVGAVGRRALVVIVPPSLEVPHLIYRGEHFGAPVRNHADTEWMRERQLESMYRQRLDERRNSDRAVGDLYDELAAGRDITTRAWLIVVAHPRIPLIGRSLDREQMSTVVHRTETTALRWVREDAGVRPLQVVDLFYPTRGLRRWVLRHRPTQTPDWGEAWMAVHDNGAVSLAAAAGGHRNWPSDGYLTGGRVMSSFLECAISDLLALLRESVNSTGISTTYDIVVGLEWSGSEPLIIQTTDHFDRPYDATSVPLARYTPVRASLRVDLDEPGYLAQVYELARDAVNQGGIENIRLIPQPSDG